MSFGTSTFSVAVWIKASWGGGNDPVFIGNKDWFTGGNQGWVIAGQTDGSTWQWNWRASSSSRADFETGGVIADGNWHHIAVTHDRSGNAVFYHDGAPIGAVSLVSKTGSITSGLPTVIGADARFNYGAMNETRIDDVAIWGRVLSDQDIATIAISPTPFEQWRIAHHNPAQLSNSLLSGPIADPDHDGVEHLMEYALGLDPSASSPWGLKIVNDIEAIATDEHLRLTITRNPLATDVTFAVEVSSDLLSWSTEDTAIETSTPTTLIVRDTIPIGPHNRRFIRLRVTQP